MIEDVTQNIQGTNNVKMQPSIQSLSEMVSGRPSTSTFLNAYPANKPQTPATAMNDRERGQPLSTISEHSGEVNANTNMSSSNMVASGAI